MPGMVHTLRILVIIVIIWILLLLSQFEVLYITKPLKVNKVATRKPSPDLSLPEENGIFFNKDTLELQTIQKTTTTDLHLNEDTDSIISEYLPMVFVITPTYTKHTQLAELLALGNTLRNARNVTWIVVEDNNELSPKVSELLEESQVPFVHLLGPSNRTENAGKPRGASNRNRALKWIRDNVAEGVIYFADDDNTYDPLLFDMIRFTKKFSMLPVGLLTNYKLSAPVVKNGVVQGFYDGWRIDRRYPVDMASFALNVKFLLMRPNASFKAGPGYLETLFLEALEPWSIAEIEPMANDCTQLLVFHTKSNGTSVVGDDNNKDQIVEKFNGTNIEQLLYF